MSSDDRAVGRSNLIEILKRKKLQEKNLKEEEEIRLKQQEEKERLQHEQSIASTSKSNDREYFKKISRLTLDFDSQAHSTMDSITSMTCIPSIGRGCSSLLGALKKKSSMSEYSDKTAGVLGKLSSISFDKPRHSKSEPEIISRHGESGKNISLMSNYINLKIDKDKGVFQYEIKFSPEVDSRNLRYKLLTQQLQKLANAHIFDGSLLYLPIQLQEKKTTLESVHPIDNSIVTLTIIFKEKQSVSNNIHFFNNLMNRVMRALTLVRIGHQDFNPTCAHAIPQHRLEVWPGYIKSVSELEGGLKLNLDAVCRVIRLDTVRDLMIDIHRKNENNFKNIVMNELITTSVLTRYNNKTYKIDDINWDIRPDFMFEKNGQKMSLIDYYRRHYNITIKDLKQPLLVHRYKQKKTTGETVEKLCLLIPELCFLTGITDSIRNDFKITKALAQTTKISPEQRRETIKNFIKQVNGDENIRKILSDWGLEMNDDIIDLKGRVLDAEEIYFGSNLKIKSETAEWQRYTSKILRTINMMDWAIVCTENNKRHCKDFLELFKAICYKVKFQIGEPRIIFLKNDSTENYITAIRSLAKSILNMVVIIFPSVRQDKYSAVKRLCCTELALPSQVIISNTLSRSDKIKNITEKIAMQINCKLGGALWALKNPFGNAMVCGIDVYHAGINQSMKGNVAAFIASLDQMLTTWHSRVCMQTPHQELVDLLKQCLSSSIKMYREKNGHYPDKIFIYRDGVGDGQLETVKNYEVAQFIKTCSLINPSYKPKLSVIIVQKRISTRIFEKREKLINPPPGTIVDSDITRRYLYDFFLVPQTVRQGTVTPIHYIVLYDDIHLKTDYMQRFTFKLCHLYYNWPGTIKVPAPCQYAHKLAYLIGQSIKSEPNYRLNNLLYYL